MSQQDELERLKKLRDSQIRTRDPTTKEKKMQGQIATKYRRTRSKENFFKDSWKGLDNIWKGLIYGAILGVVTMVISMPNASSINW